MCGERVGHLDATWGCASVWGTSLDDLGQLNHLCKQKPGLLESRQVECRAAAIFWFTHAGFGRICVPRISDHRPMLGRARVTTHKASQPWGTPAAGPPLGTAVTWL